MKGNMLQSYNVLVPNIRVRKLQIDPQQFYKFAAQEVFSYFNETEEESELDDDDYDYNQVSSLVNSKLLIAKIIQVICSIFRARFHSADSHHQMK